MVLRDYTLLRAVGLVEDAAVVEDDDAMCARDSLLDLLHLILSKWVRN